MCGIISIVNNTSLINSQNLTSASVIIRHRGPDDEGFLTWDQNGEPIVWAGDDTAASTIGHWGYHKLTPGQNFKVGFGHRRLSILDLSPAGHQPMVYKKANLAITYNGEIYNYIEIKKELETAGHKFNTASDTEVILHAWEEWGVKCLDKFNGMFAFVILDHKKKELYAVRDRFGVKPLYYYKGENALYLASEIKQIKMSPDYKFGLNEQATRLFLAQGVLDNANDTFYMGINRIPGGSYLRVDLSADTRAFEIKQWYTLNPKKWKGSYADAVNQFRDLLTDTVRLRLRSDVTVGSCLSGGLDSSSIVCIAAELLKEKGDFAGQETVTACYEEAKYDEWNFAQEVIKKTNAHPHRVFPSFSQLQQELEALLWHQDEPIATTSIFSQWAVFKTTHEAGLKVMIDGQGADEQLAGYGGNDLSLYAGLLGKAHLLSLYDEARNYNKEHGAWPYGFLLGALQLNMGDKFSSLLPEKLKIKKEQKKTDWLRDPAPVAIHNGPAHSLQENLLRQLYGDPLPALLRYEDHNSMAWSVESRTPFMDYRLVEFTLGLPENFVYKRGLRKTILREAMHNIIPEAIENRKDKMGFVTPEEVWMKGEGKEWFIKGVEDTLKVLPALFNESKVRQFATDMIGGRIPFDFTIWRIVCLGKWYAAVTNNVENSH